MKSPNNQLHAYGITTLCKNIIFSLILISSIASFSQGSQQLAFPSSSGAAAYITGGRGGIVYHVTNLNNSGSGSFRDAVSASNRIIVFDVSGTIELTSPLTITADNLTIAGQSAPQGGITVTGKYVHFQGIDNVIVRYIRFRPDYTQAAIVDALNATHCTNFIVDHCSISWGGDEAFSIVGNSSNVTVQNCILAESKTAMLAGDSNNPISTNFSIIGNLFYNISHRFPNVNAIRTDVINNVVHNWFTRLKVVSAHDNTQLNEINNYYQKGVKTTQPLSPNWSINWIDIGSGSQRSNIRIYTDGNVYPSFLTEAGDDWTLYRHRFNVNSGAYAGTNQWDAANTDFQLLTPLALLGETTITTAEEALINVPLNAGTNRFLNSDGSIGTYRDSVDSIYVTNVANNTSEDYTYPPVNVVNKQSYIDFHNSVSATPINSRSGGYYVSSTDIPEVWFLANVPNGETALDLAPSGYMWIEEFLNGVDLGNQNTGITANAGTDISICEGQSTTLTASGGNNYEWSTGELTQSITVSPNTTTTYSVTVSDTNGNSDTDDVIVTVNPIPTANAGNDKTICLGESTTLTASGGNSYLWNTGQTTQTITVNPNINTLYTVTVTQNGCESSDEVNVLISEIPTANAGNDITIDEGESTTLTASGGGTYLWNTGETTPSITVNPMTTTTYSVVVTNASDCTNQDEVIVTVNQINVNANAGTDVSICEGESTTLTASGGNNYSWSTGETTQSITVNPNTTTNYSVIVSIGNISDTDDVIVTVNALPTANAGNDITIDEGESTTLTASGGGTYLWNTGETTQNITVNPITTTTYSVVVTNASNCTNQNEVIVTVNQITVNANAGTDVSICEGESTTLSASGGNNYEWSTGETTQSITVNPTTTTNYSVIVSIGNITDTDDVIVTVNALPIVDAGNDITIINGESTTLTATGGNSYLWNTGETAQSITVNPNITTTYSVTGNQNGCEDEDSITVFVESNVVASVSDDQRACDGYGYEITLTASGANTYQWNNGATQPNIAVNPSITTTYEVTGYINECYEAKEVTVIVIEQVVAYAGESVMICAEESATLTATGGDEYIWSTGETTPTIIVSPDETTEYTVTVFNELDFDEATVLVEVDFQCNDSIIVDETPEFDFRIFPNPTTDILNVRMAGLYNTSKFYFYDVSGKILLIEDIEETASGISFTKQIDLSSYSNGLYFLKIVYDDQEIIEKVLIK